MVDPVEVEWASGLPRRMYSAVHGSATTRQVRLYMAACCRLHSDVFFDPRLELALSAVERCADDPQAEAEAEAIWHELMTTRPRTTSRDSASEIERAIQAAWDLLQQYWAGEEHGGLRHALSHAALLALREKPREVITGGEGDAVDYCTNAVEAAEVRKGVGVTSGELIRQRMAGLLRDIFANPFRPIAFDPRWRSADVIGLARGIYDDRRFDRLPLLSDALLDADCDDASIISHCRFPGPHVRGCWVVDAVLGLE